MVEDSFSESFISTSKARRHKAYFCVYKDLMDSPLGPRRVEWIQDELRDFIDV
jgi:hypothetical protein